MILNFHWSVEKDVGESGWRLVGTERPTPAVCSCGVSHLSEHPPAVSVSVQRQVPVQHLQSVLLEDGRYIHGGLDGGDGLVKDAVDKDHALLRGRTCTRQTDKQTRWSVQVVSAASTEHMLEREAFEPIEKSVK